MKHEIRYGRLKYLSFVLLDIICLIIANCLASLIYTNGIIDDVTSYEHWPVVIIMIVIDLAVTFFLNTLERVLRRCKKKELLAGSRHIGASFVSLAVILFSFKKGADYSRGTVFFAYCIYFFFFVGGHIIWKAVLGKMLSKNSHRTAVLMTTDRFVDEGLDQLKKLNIDVRYIYFLKKNQKETISNIPVVNSWEETASAICWDYLEKIYIYGLDHQMVPQYLISACKDMGMNFNLVDFNYRVLDIKTVRTEDQSYGALSFLEGKRDIPFPIRRVYWITETGAERHRGFHAHKLNCQLLYCPYGIIDIILDDGEKRTTVTLDKPDKGLMLMPGLWREMVWKKSGSVLCVLASEYYDPEEYIRDYDEFIEYNKKYRKSLDNL